MQNNKASDSAVISAEHLKYADPIISHLISTIANKILESGSVPECLKNGIITPILKKNKPAKKPDSYRRITVTSIVGKVIEKEILAQTKKTGTSHKSSLQYGFTEGVPPLTAAMVLTEAVQHAHNHQCDVMVIFRDASKAFDVVCHPGLLNILHDHEI